MAAKEGFRRITRVATIIMAIGGFYALLALIVTLAGAHLSRWIGGVPVAPLLILCLSLIGIGSVLRIVGWIGAGFAAPGS